MSSDLVADASVLEPCRHALLALEPEGDLLLLSDRGKCSFRTKPIRHFFRTAQALINGVGRGDPTAVGCLVLLTHAANLPTHTRAVGLAVLAAKALHADEYLILECARQLVMHDDEAAYRAVLPFATGRWAGGGVVHSRATFARRAELLLEFMREARPLTDPSLHWPTIAEGSVGEAPPQGDWLFHGDMIEDVYGDATPEQQTELLLVATELFRNASTGRARRTMCRTLARLGSEIGCFESCESAYEDQREFGFSMAQKYFGVGLIERYGHVFDSDAEVHRLQRESFLKARGKRLGAPVLSFDESEWLFVYQRCRWDIHNYYTRDAPLELRLAVYDRKQRRVTRDHAFAKTKWEPQSVNITHPKDSRGRWLLIQAVNNSAELERHYVTYDPNGELHVARTKDELKELLKATAPTRDKKVRA